MEAGTWRRTSGWVVGRRGFLKCLQSGIVLFFAARQALANQKQAEVSVQLHMYIQVKSGKASEFETRYRTAYLPIVRKQKGFRSSILLRKHDSQGQYEIDLAFDSESLRAAWANSHDHDQAWKPLGEVIAQITVQGYDVIS